MDDSQYQSRMRKIIDKKKIKENRDDCEICFRCALKEFRKSKILIKDIYPKAKHKEDIIDAIKLTAVMARGFAKTANGFMLKQKTENNKKFTEKADLYATKTEKTVNKFLKSFVEKK